MLKVILLLIGISLIATSCIHHSPVVNPAKSAVIVAPDSSKIIKEDNPVMLSEFIPEDYTILDTIPGDLNLDLYSDMIIVLKKVNEAEIVQDEPKRPLLLLTGQQNGNYKLEFRNDNAVLCAFCGGTRADPFLRVVIKKGYFSIEHYGGMNNLEWTKTTTFKYSSDDHNWYLYKDEEEQDNTEEEEQKKITLKTVKDFGKVPFEKFDNK